MMTTAQPYLWDGDPKITVGEDGAEMTFIGGQPVMDQGLENPVILSLFTEPGWVGNALASSDAEKLGSIYEETCRQPVTLSSLNSSANAAKAALRWMISGGIASKITAVSRNPSGHIRETKVTVTPPGGYPHDLTFAQAGPNWLQQKDNPAYRRV